MASQITRVGIISILLAIFIVSVTGLAAGATTICPFPNDPDEDPQGVPAGTSIKSLTVGSVYGFSTVSQENLWTTNGNISGTQSNVFSSISAPGIQNIALDTRLTTKLYGFTSTTARAVEYSGQGLALSDSSLFGVISNGNETEPSCEQALGGANARFTSGSYGSQTYGVVSGYGMTMQQEIGTGDAAPVKPSGMQGTITVFGQSEQRYQGMTSTTGTEATFGGISTIAHQFNFNTIQEV